MASHLGLSIAQHCCGSGLIPGNFCIPWADIHTHDGTLLRHKKGCSAIYSNTMDPETMLIPSEGIKTNNMTWYHAHVESKT